jgi:4-amino-4-deoxy-L-arabinose transferase-like glycosyltransferase
MMTQTVSPTLALPQTRISARAWHRLALAAALLLAVFLHFYGLEREGYANQYYAAAVKSMSQTWHNFFYASFDPGGFVSVDKPPLGLWVQVLSVKVFGFSGWSLLFPQALAGVLSVALLYHLVSRVFGPTAGVMAALALALTPISVAANRNNTMDSQLVLTSLLVAWAVSLAAERGKLRWLLLCAFWVGVGFNIKMLQAVMVLPAFYLLYLLAPIPWWKRLIHLGAATLLLIVVSLAWVLAVDLTPADRRPFVGSSHNNTVMELIVGHNGMARLGVLGRLFGSNPTGPGVQPTGGQPPQNQPSSGPQGQPQFGPPPQGQPPSNGVPSPNGQPFGGSQPNNGQPPAGGPSFGAPPPAGSGQFPPTQGPGQGPAIGNPNQPNQPPNGPRGLQDETGEAGPFRLFNKQLAGQASWLLPLAGLGLLAAAWQIRLRWPLSAQHQALALWGAWLVPQLIFFSYAGLFHRYYLEMLSPAIAALAGAGVAALWADYQRGGLRGWLLPLALVATAALEVFILKDFPEWGVWLIPVVAGLTLMAAAGLFIARRSASPLRSLIAAAGFVALLAAPAVWSLTPLMGSNVSLPYAGPDVVRGAGPGQRGIGQPGGAPESNQLAQFLLDHRGDAKYLLGTLNANTAAPVILATGEPVMAMGGFSGSDNILTAEALEAMMARGEVRFFLIPSSPTGAGGQPPSGNNPQNRGNDLTRWIGEHCAKVDPALWRGQSAGPGAPPNAGPGGPQELFDCAGA